MSIILIKRLINRLPSHPSSIFKYYTSFHNPFKFLNKYNKTCTQTVCDNANKNTIHSPIIKLPSMFPFTKNCLNDVNIDLVDLNIWPQTRLMEPKINSKESKSIKFDNDNEKVDAFMDFDEVDPNMWPQSRLNGYNKMCNSSSQSGDFMDFEEVDDSRVREAKSKKINDDNKMCNSNSQHDGFMDFEEVDDLRLRKQLFFKLDKDSKEFEEYNINFHQKKYSKKKLKKQKNQNTKLECKKLEKQTKEESKPKNPSKESNNKKRVRVETFNQLTAPYHMPFCLDIFVTKGSVRASIIHRVTSRVVAVAHSISKDLKFDLKSRKDVKACSTVGSVLAKRAIEDDIHNVVYTPRKGDRIEGKLEVVLKAIVDCGVDVKVKLKQRKLVKRAQIQCSSNMQHNTT